MARSDKNWTAGTLKSRGWSEKLMAQLLPRPRFAHIDGRRVRTWRRDDVLEAEKQEAFLQAKAAAAARRQQQKDQQLAQTDRALQQTAALLRRIWQQPEAPTPEQQLASRYHQAILSQIPHTGWAAGRKPGQAMSYVRALLDWNRTSAPDALCAVLRRFTTAAVWIGQNQTHPLVQRLQSDYADALQQAAAQELAAFSAEQPQAHLTGLLQMEPFPLQELLAHPLAYLYSVCYVPKAIRSSLELLAALHPKDEYPQARAMQRHFILHIGGTNTGKTYAGFQRLKQAPTGVYLAPLRLLALEAQELLLDAGVDCSLTTGEEEDCQEGDTHVSATAEKLNLSQTYDVAVIDECQMISDRARGYAWTRAILGILSPEIHLCAAPEAKTLLLQLIRSCGDTYEVVQHQRKTPLLCMRRTVDYEDLQPGDALITFSKVGVLSAAEDLRRRGKEPAIIYGALPYSTRRKQVDGFLSGRMQYVVSTDAIGMGLNLPIQRIIFMETEKFDGVERRALKPEEVQQIAGRAGRYGMYPRGYVGAMQNLAQIRMAMETVVPPLQQAVVGFSDLVLSVDFDLLEVLEVWNRMPTVAPFAKLDISRYLHIISTLRERGFHLRKDQELRAANIPFDETEPELVQLFHQLLRTYLAGQPLPQPELSCPPGTEATLPQLELHCRKLDLFFSVCKAFSCPLDRDALYDARELAAQQINTILLHNLKNNIRFCSQCGAALPLHHAGRLCNACYQKRRRPW